VALDLVIAGLDRAIHHLTIRFDMRWMRGSSPPMTTEWTLMTLHLESQAVLDDAVRTLVTQDKRLGPILDSAGMPALRRREPGFAGLAHIVCGQQLSTASAGAIWARLSTAFDPFEAEAIRRARADRLGRLGLSAAKIKTLKHVARELAAGRLNLDVLANEDADAAHNTLIALPGIGPWTADVYLLFCLGHGDAWPAGDLAVQEAIKVGLGLPARPTAKEMMPLAEPWRPLRGAAAHLWWSYYRVIKKREGVIGAETPAEKTNGVSNKVAVAKRSSTSAKIAARKSPK
jgi:DNA-3-methyladenine glycosylase II